MEKDEEIRMNQTHQQSPQSQSKSDLLNGSAAGSGRKAISGEFHGVQWIAAQSPEFWKIESTVNPAGVSMTFAGGSTIPFAGIKPTPLSSFVGIGSPTSSSASPAAAAMTPAISNSIVRGSRVISPTMMGSCTSLSRRGSAASGAGVQSQKPSSRKVSLGESSTLTKQSVASNKQIREYQEKNSVSTLLQIAKPPPSPLSSSALNFHFEGKALLSRFSHRLPAQSPTSSSINSSPNQKRKKASSEHQSCGYLESKQEQLQQQQQQKQSEDIEQSQQEQQEKQHRRVQSSSLQNRKSTAKNLSHANTGRFFRTNEEHHKDKEIVRENEKLLKKEMRKHKMFLEYSKVGPARNISSLQARIDNFFNNPKQSGESGGGNTCSNEVNSLRLSNDRVHSSSSAAFFGSSSGVGSLSAMAAVATSSAVGSSTPIINDITKWKIANVRPSSSGKFISVKESEQAANQIAKAIELRFEKETVEDVQAKSFKIRSNLDDIVSNIRGINLTKRERAIRDELQLLNSAAISKKNLRDFRMHVGSQGTNNNNPHVNDINEGDDDTSIRAYTNQGFKIENHKQNLPYGEEQQELKKIILSKHQNTQQFVLEDQASTSKYCRKMGIFASNVLREIQSVKSCSRGVKKSEKGIFEEQERQRRIQIPTILLPQQMLGSKGTSSSVSSSNNLGQTQSRLGTNQQNSKQQQQQQQVQRELKSASSLAVFDTLELNSHFNDQVISKLSGFDSHLLLPQDAQLSNQNTHAQQNNMNLLVPTAPSGIGSAVFGTQNRLKSSHSVQHFSQSQLLQVEKTGGIQGQLQSQQSQQYQQLHRKLSSMQTLSFCSLSSAHLKNKNLAESKRLNIEAYNQAIREIRAIEKHDEKWMFDPDAPRIKKKRRIREKLKQVLLMCHKLGVPVERIGEVAKLSTVPHQNKGSFVFLECVKKNEIEAVLKLLEKNQYFISDFDQVFNTAYFFDFLACKKGHLDLARIFIARGANIEAKDTQNRTPLFYALVGEHREIIKELLCAKCTPWSGDKFSFLKANLSYETQALLKMAKRADIICRLIQHKDDREKAWNVFKQMISKA